MKCDIQRRNWFRRSGENKQERRKELENIVREREKLRVKTELQVGYINTGMSFETRHLSRLAESF